MTVAGPLVAGVELGGTKCVATLGRGPGAIVEQVTVATTDADATLAALSAVLARWQRDASFAALGIGSFGPIDLDPRSSDRGVIGSTTKPGWRGARVLDRLRRAADVSCRIDTDVNAAALGERRWGAGRGTARFAYVTVGTGVGVGFAIDGMANPPVTELGHVRVAGAAPGASVCAYHDDCVEGLAAGPAIARAMAGADPARVPLDDPRWAGAIDALGQLCHVIVSTGSFARIAFGGGVMVGNPALLPLVETAMRRSVNAYLDLAPAPMLVVAELGAQAGPLGTIALAHDAQLERPALELITGELADRAMMRRRVP